MAAHTPVRAHVTVPPGHIIANDVWKFTELAEILQESLQVLFEDSLGIIDFHPSHGVGVVYISTADLVTPNFVRKKLAQLRKANTVRGVVLVEVSESTEQQFTSMQKFVVMEMGLSLIPVSTLEEAAAILAELTKLNDRTPWRFNSRSRVVDGGGNLVQSLQVIPGLGEVKAKALLERFGTIGRVAGASQTELKKVVGAKAANVAAFFSQ